MGEHSTLARYGEKPVDQCLQVADLLLRRSRLLELRRCGAVRLYDQPAGRALLRAGAEPDPGARPYSALRRLRHAWPRANVVLPASVAARPGVERSPAGDCILVDQHRTRRYGRPEHVAAWLAAGVGLG